jgi:hypothetical protein
VGAVGGRLAGAFLEREMTVLTLPRSMFYAVWRQSSSPDFPSDLFPLPIDRLKWAILDLGSEAEPLQLILAVETQKLTELRERPGATGFTATFLGETLNANRTGDWILLDLRAEPAEITAVRQNRPLFCRMADRSNGWSACLRSLVRSVQVTHPSFSPGVVATLGTLTEQETEQLVPQFVLESVSPVDPALTEAIFQIGEKSETRRWVATWSRHEKNVLAFGAVLAIMGSILLQARTQVVVNHLSALSAPTARSDQRLTPEPLLTILPTVIKNVPRATCLADLLYEPAQRRLSIRGETLNYERVSAFASALARDGLREMRIERSSLLSVGGDKVVEFSLEGKTP